MNDTPATARPFRILGIQQIAIGGTDKARMRRLWVTCWVWSTRALL